MVSNNRNLENQDNLEYWTASYNRYSIRKNKTDVIWEVYDTYARPPKKRFNTWLDRLFGIEPARLFFTDVIAIGIFERQAKEIAFLLNGDRHLCRELMLKDGGLE